MIELQIDLLKIEKGDSSLNSEIAQQIVESEIDNGDITKFIRFKHWAKENLVGLSAIAITIGGIITSIEIGLRHGATTAAKITWSLCKSIAHIAARSTPIVASTLTLLANILSLGAKATFFLANNLWMLGGILLSTIYILKGRKHRK